MKGTEKIIGLINAEANEKAAALTEAAMRESEQIRTDYERRARERYSAKIRKGVQEGQAWLDSLSRVAGMEAKKAILEQKQELISETFDLAQTKLAELPEAQYLDFLCSLARQAAQGEGGELILNSSDRKKYGKRLISALKEELPTLTLGKECRDIRGGLILRRGSVESNCSIEQLIRASREEMSAEIAKRLFR